MRIILVLVVAWALAGCQESSGTPTVVQFWAMGREGEVVRQLIPDFERAHPDVRVEVQQLPWSAAHQKLLTAFAGEALPDVAQLGNTWLPEFVALHALDPVEPSVVDASDYFPGIWQTNVIDQTAYGVPWYVDTRLLFYRRDLLAEAGYADPPTTWAEWIDMLRAIKQRAATPSLWRALAAQRVPAVAGTCPAARGAASARRGHAWQLSQRGLQARSSVLSGNVRQRLCAGDERKSDFQCLG